MQTVFSAESSLNLYLYELDKRFCCVFKKKFNTLEAQDGSTREPCIYLALTLSSYKW